MSFFSLRQSVSGTGCLVMSYRCLQVMHSLQPCDLHFCISVFISFQCFPSCVTRTMFCFAHVRLCLAYLLYCRCCCAYINGSCSWFVSAICSELIVIFMCSVLTAFFVYDIYVLLPPHCNAELALWVP